MAKKKYLDYDGLVRVSGEIKNRVKLVDSLPATATDGTVCLYVGEDTADYKKGHTYQYQTDSWVDITSANTFNDEDFSVDAQNEVSLLPARRVYRGTRAAWDLLSVAEKTQYGATAFTDDEGGTPSDVYSTNETLTNKVWIDGKPIYRKVVYFGDLPNNTSKVIVHGISSLGYIIHWYGFCKGKTNELQRPIPFPGINSTNDQSVRLYSTNTTLSIACVGDNSAYGDCYVIIEYTKTTD